MKTPPTPSLDSLDRPDSARMNRTIFDDQIGVQIRQCEHVVEDPITDTMLWTPGLLASVKSVDFQPREVRLEKPLLRGSSVLLCTAEVSLFILDNNEIYICIAGYRLSGFLQHGNTSENSIHWLPDALTIFGPQLRPKLAYSESDSTLLSLAQALIFRTAEAELQRMTSLNPINHTVTWRKYTQFLQLTEKLQRGPVGIFCEKYVYIGKPCLSGEEDQFMNMTLEGSLKAICWLNSQIEITVKLWLGDCTWEEQVPLSKEGLSAQRIFLAEDVVMPLPRYSGGRAVMKLSERFIQGWVKRPVVVD